MNITKEILKKIFLKHTHTTNENLEEMMNDILYKFELSSLVIGKINRALDKIQFPLINTMIGDKREGYFMAIEDVKASIENIREDLNNEQVRTY